MARLISFMISDSAQNLSGVQHIIAPTVALRPQFIPGNFSFAVSFGVTGINLNDTNTMKIQIKKPSGTVIQELSDSSLPVIQEKDTLPAEYQGFIGGLEFRNVVIDEEGCYEFVLYINGELVGKRPIPIFKRKG